MGSSDDTENDSLWADVSIDSGLACVEGRGDDETAESDEAEGACFFFELARVFRAVEAGVTPDALRALIREVARGCPKRRRETVNLQVWPRARLYGGDPTLAHAPMTPLQMAHTTHAWPLAGALLLSGADVRGVFDGRLTSLAACAVYGYADGVQQLLDSGRHDANERMQVAGASRGGQTAAHAALAERVGRPEYEGQLSCLAALARIGGADLEARDAWGDTVVLKLGSWGARWLPLLLRRALRLLALELGADVHAKNTRDGRTLLFALMRPRLDDAVQTLLDECGASADVVDNSGVTPLMLACTASYFSGGWPWQAAPEVAKGALALLLPRSSAATRRAVRNSDGKSCLDLLLEDARRNAAGAVGWHGGAAAATPEWQRQAIAELAASGVSVQDDASRDFARQLGVEV
jgi:ankyrin repeat protein